MDTKYIFIYSPNIYHDTFYIDKSNLNDLIQAHQNISVREMGFKFKSGLLQISFHYARLPFTY